MGFNVCSQKKGARAPQIGLSSRTTLMPQHVRTYTAGRPTHRRSRILHDKFVLELTQDPPSRSSCDSVSLLLPFASVPLPKSVLHVQAIANSGYLYGESPTRYEKAVADLNVALVPGFSNATDACRVVFCSIGVGSWWRIREHGSISCWGLLARLFHNTSILRHYHWPEIIGL